MSARFDETSTSAYYPESAIGSNLPHRQLLAPIQPRKSAWALAKMLPVALLAQITFQPTMLSARTL